jgi:hypothetical protein
MTKIEIKTIWGDIIFTHEKENNTVKDTLLEAVRLPVRWVQGADIRPSFTPIKASLCGADVSAVRWMSLSQRLRRHIITTSTQGITLQ